MLLKVLPETPTVQFVFYDGKPKESVLQQIAAIRGGIKTYHIDELRELGKANTDADLSSRRPTPETDACIMYTSGSTGKPKGVQISHENLIASVSSVHFLYGHHLPEGTVYLAYLPLAHVFEFIVELVAVYVGATAVYARPKTLTDASVRNSKGDLTAYQPTIMLGVPAVWETIRKGIVGKLDKMGWVTKTVVGAAMQMQKRRVPVLSWLADEFVLSSVREPTGGNIRWGINGGAAISKDTQEFMSLAVMPLMQGEFGVELRNESSWADGVVSDRLWND
jgi:long-chain acyl-CoA synthetase